MWPDPQEIADLVTFIEEILNGKLHFYAVWHEIVLARKTTSRKRCADSAGLFGILVDNYFQNCRLVTYITSTSFHKILISMSWKKQKHKQKKHKNNNM